VSVGGAEVVSFEDAFEAEAREAFGDLGPATAAAPAADRGDRGGDRSGRPRRGPRRR
jgi:hypothetical protein